MLDTLTKEGFINDLKAQLRRKVVETLEAQKKADLGRRAKYVNTLSLKTTRKVISNEDGLLCAELIREFFAFYKMEHTLSVFVPEMNLDKNFPKTRDEMARECGIMRGQDDTSKPLILTMVEKIRVGDYGPNAYNGSAQKSMGTDEYSNSPN